MFEENENYSNQELLPIIGGTSKSNSRLISLYKKLGPTFKLADFSKNLYYDSQKIIDNISLIAAEERLKIIGFVSSQPNEGTSTIAYMASLMAIKRQNGQFQLYSTWVEEKNHSEVLRSDDKNSLVLIDTQLKHPSLHDLFQVSIEPGLGEYLADKIPFNKIVHEICFSRLKLVTAGGKVNYQFTKTDYEQLKSLLTYLRKQHELIFLDIPPLLHFSEGMALSRLCDGVILIVRANKTKREVVTESKSILEKANVNIIGSILNRRKFFIPDIIYHRL